MNDIELLVGRSIQGDKEAFGRLALAHRRAVISYIYHMINDWIVSEDICQEVFIKAFTSLPRFRQEAPGSFKKWLMTIAHRTTVDYLRRQRPVVYVDFTEGSPVPAEPGGESGGVSEYERFEEKNMMDTAIKQLPEIYRYPILLRYREDLSYRDISEILGIPVNTVATRIHRGISALQKILKESEVMEDGIQKKR